MEPIREWHIVISGFLQRAGDVNGSVQVWGELRKQLASRRSSGDVEILLRSWRCNMADLAEMISKLRPADAPPRICIYGYSWGGMTAANLARELQRRGLAVEHIVLCDAVYRHWYLLGAWRAFVPWRAIRIPDNVRRVTQFRQRRSLPSGHSIQAVNSGRTDIGPVQWLDVEHCWMDDTPEWKQACLAAALGV